MKRDTFDALSMPLTGTRLIEASAGTGKTFSLAALYLRLIVEEQVPVREILVITFTKAATQELRERIRLRLVSAARLAHDPNTATDSTETRFTEALIEKCAESREAVARRLADAAHRMDEATITTIHGFSQRAAAENAFDSALAFDRGEQVDDRAVYDEVIADYWREHALGDKAVTDFVEWWPNPSTLGEALKAFRSRPHAQLVGLSSDEIEKLAVKIRTHWSTDSEAFQKEFRACWDAGIFSQSKKDGLKAGIEKAGGIDGAMALLSTRLESQQPIPSLPEWVEHLKDARGRLLKNGDPARGEALFNTPLARSLCTLQPLARLVAMRQARAQTEVIAAARKRERRQFSFNDMISALHTAITAPDHGQRLADALHTAWPWALVDEFQDTDPLQYETLQRIYRNRDHGALLLIGDPKQAIYGFRGGDVYAYLAAAADAGEEAYNLDVNYRSTQGVLDAIEALFRAPGDDAFLVDGIDYQHVTAGHPSQRSLWLNGQTCAPMTLWHLAPEKPNKDAAEATCREACVAQILQLLDPEHGGSIRRHNPKTDETVASAVQPRDIAVLVNKNAQAADIQRALARLGIAAVCLHRDSVFASDEAGDVLQVLQAAASPVDEDLLRGALAGELLGCRLGDLIAMAGDEQVWQARVEQFQNAHHDWRVHGVLTLLEPMIQRAAEWLLTYEDGERRVSNYLQIAELLADAEADSFGMAGLLRWLRQAMQAADNGEGGDAEQLRLESDAALVRITTVHKAKGLEYPIVLLPFAPWLGIPPKAASPDKPPYDFHTSQGQAQIDVIGSDAACKQAIIEARAEALRLLYVALTRTEIACFLPWAAASGTPNSPLASLLHRADGIHPDFWTRSNKPEPLSNELAGQRLRALAEKTPDAIAIKQLPHTSRSIQRLEPLAAATGQARTDLPQPRPPWSIFSFTRLVHAADNGPAGVGADDEVGGTPVATDTDGARLPELPGGMTFGSAIHALLETAEPWQWPAPDVPLPPASLSAVAETLRGYGVALPADKNSSIVVMRSAELIRNALHTPLPEIGPLAALPKSSRLTEMEFMLRLGGGSVDSVLDLLNTHGYAHSLPRQHQASELRGLMHGFIDLVAEYNGRYYVIDYKTNWLGDHAEDYAPAALEVAMQQRHYDLQYLIYTTALHRFLRQRLTRYRPADHLGGVLYLFLRGMAPDASERGIYQDRPDIELIESLDRLLDAQACTS